ncbi:magnesium and cobalt transport protein CorA [Streptomyces sp. NPDC058548]|uniref:magnesium and cobalt transport protein CorA n=1 Tax=unclassified Streptomyces TaxID=2593676 RepID=UPI003647A63C
MTVPHPAAQPPSVVDCALYENGRRRPGLLPLDQAMTACHATAGSFVWIGLHAPTADQLQTVADAFDLHPLAVEDAVHAHQRPKLERYGDTLFLVLKTAVYIEHEKVTPTSEIVDTGEIMIFMGADFVIVVRHGPSHQLTGVRHDLEEHAELLAHGPASVLHAIADTVVDDYLDVIQAMETDVEEVETEVFSPEHGSEAGRVYQLKRELLELRRCVSPLLQPLRELSEGHWPHLAREITPYLRDVHDHLVQANERVTALSDLVDTALVLAHAQTSVRQNADVRRISAYAALIAVPISVFAIYGMNFDHMPELGWTFGYPLVLAVTATVCALLHRTLRRRGWL